MPCSSRCAPQSFSRCAWRCAWQCLLLAELLAVCTAMCTEMCTWRCAPGGVHLAVCTWRCARLLSRLCSRLCSRLFIWRVLLGALSIFMLMAKEWCCALTSTMVMSSGRCGSPGCPHVESWYCHFRCRESWSGHFSPSL